MTSNFKRKDFDGKDRIAERELSPILPVTVGTALPDTLPSAADLDVAERELSAPVIPGVTVDIAFPVRDLPMPDAPFVSASTTVACEFPVSGNNPFAPGDWQTPTCGRTPAARCEGHRLKYFVCEYHWREAHPPSCKAPVPPFPL